MSESQRRILTPEEERWVAEHYAETPNHIIQRRLGVGSNWVIKYARAHDLHKSKAYRSRQGRLAGEAFRERGDFSAQQQGAARMREKWAREHPGEPLPGTYVKGTKRSELFTPEQERMRLERATESRRAQVARDRRRIRMGLPPLTNCVKEYTLDHSLVNLRRNMRTRHGYVTDRNHPWVVWFTPETTRSKRMEARCAKYGIEVRAMEDT